jgi:hypothetical protein
VRSNYLANGRPTGQGHAARMTYQKGTNRKEDEHELRGIRPEAKKEEINAQENKAIVRR